MSLSQSDGQGGAAKGKAFCPRAVATEVSLWDTQLGVPTRQLTAMQGPDPDKPGCSWLRSAREPGWPVTW